MLQDSQTFFGVFDGIIDSSVESSLIMNGNGDTWGLVILSVGAGV